METTGTFGSPKSTYYNEMSSHFFPTKMSQTMTSGFGGPKASASQYIMPFTRVNRDYRDKKNLNLYLNDSTYLNPSDPNSMRDQGIIRNAPYNVDTKAYNSTQNFLSSGNADPFSKTTNSISWKGFPASVNERSTTAYVSGNIKNRDV